MSPALTFLALVNVCEDRREARLALTIIAAFPVGTESRGLVAAVLVIRAFVDVSAPVIAVPFKALLADAREGTHGVLTS